MTPVQHRAFLEFVGFALRTPMRPDGLVVDFPDAAIVRAYQDTPQGVPRWCTVNTLAQTSLQSGGDEWREPMRMIYRLDVVGDSAGPVLVTLSPQNSGYEPESAGPVTPPGGGLEAFRDAILTALQDLEGPTHPATYIADDTGEDPAILATAVEAARGVWLNLEASTADVDVVQVRDSMALHTRDLGEVVFSIQVASRHDDRDPNPELAAMQLAQRIRTWAFSRIATANLRATGLAPMRCEGPRDLSALLRGSQWQTRAVLEMTCSVMRATVEQPGTIESMQTTGTLESEPAGLPPITITTE